MTKLQKAVVNWLKKNVPVKKTKFAHTHVVQYFSAGRALDALMKVSCLKTSAAATCYSSGLPLVDGEVEGRCRTSTRVQRAGHRPDAGADEAQDVPQVILIKSAPFN